MVTLDPNRGSQALIQHNSKMVDWDMPAWIAIVNLSHWIFPITQRKSGLDNLWSPLTRPTVE